eukprot:TRINITY_DN14176_c0_g3_i5.p1 TRINITY_DN14176_c0_g3~~TRINITY_DN14176_c0_g3_i5.p1  ORF type:complete len:392 (-),score=125.80 TRINITY_DN14176_c0_g3_i5:309-1484(-)
MAPRKGVAAKRGATETKASVAKKQKEDPNIKALKDAIHRASALPESCRKMLLEIASGDSLALPVESRSETHHALIQLLQKALDGVVEQLQEALSSETQTVTNVEAALAELDTQCKDKTHTAEDAMAVLEAKRVELDDAKKVEADASAALAEKQKEQSSRETSLQELQKKKESLVKAIDVDFKAILEGAWKDDEDGKDANACYEALLPVAKELALDDSLMTALPATCAKKAAERGDFDMMVTEQLSKCLQEKLTALQKEIEEAQPALQSGAEDIQTAQSVVSEAAEKTQSATNAMQEAQGLQVSAATEAKAAAAAVSQKNVELRKAEKARGAAEGELECFKTHNVKCFEHLRDRTEKKSDAPEPVSQQASECKTVEAPNASALEVATCGGGA